MRSIIVKLLISTPLIFQITSLSSQGYLYGRIEDKTCRDEEKGLPMSQIVVKFNGAIVTETTSNFNGFYFIDSLDHGNYEVIASAISYGDSIQFISINKNDSIQVNFGLPANCREYTWGWQNKTCPKCNKKSKVKEIYYSEIPIAFSRKDRKRWAYYKSSGFFGVCRPTWYCLRCDHEF